jgi:uncharacterized protein
LIQCIQGNPHRLVLDTHVVLEMLVWHSPRQVRLLAMQQAGSCVFLIDEDTLEEWRRVLAYPTLKLEEKQQAIALADYLAYSKIELHAPAPTDLPRCRDVNDQKFLDLAYRTDATALLTRDKKLLKVGKNKRYKQRFLTITPELFLERLEQVKEETYSD